jgi:hypothetical protein
MREEVRRDCSRVARDPGRTGREREGCGIRYCCPVRESRERRVESSREERNGG